MENQKHTTAHQPFFSFFGMASTNFNVICENLYGKDRRRQLLYYVNLIGACKNVLYQLVYIVYIGKKFVFLKRNFVFNKPVGPKNVKKMVCLLCDFKILLTGMLLDAIWHKISYLQ